MKVEIAYWIAKPLEYGPESGETEISAEEILELAKTFDVMVRLDRKCQDGQTRNFVWLDTKGRGFSGR